MAESTRIFGKNLHEIEEEWREADLEPSYGSVKNDIMIQRWDELCDPVVEFKKEGLYNDLKNLVHSRRISGTFYRVVDEHEHFEHLQAEDKIDYRSCLTGWFVNFREDEYEEDCCFMKITCGNVPGLEIKDREKVASIILGECQLTVLSRSEKIIEVCI